MFSRWLLFKFRGSDSSFGVRLGCPRRRISSSLLGHMQQSSQQSHSAQEGIRKSFFLKLPSPFTVMGIETSCDDTGVAILNSEGSILAETLRSQQTAHEQYSGIVPGLAARYHAHNLPGAIKDVLAQANMSIMDVGAIAVTRGPGLAPCLMTGINAAKVLALSLGKPLVGVHHMEAHALTARLTEKGKVEYPFLSLLISGGHTLLVIVKSPIHFEQIGTTLDDSVGDAFDKVARYLKLSWLPGITGGPGAAVELAARTGDPLHYEFTIPMRHKQTCDFSFSGLKAAVKRTMEDVGFANTAVVNDVAASFQKTAFDHVEDKLQKAFEMCEERDIKIRTLVVSGGVACNMEIRRRAMDLAKAKQVPCVFPPPRLCRDNGVMIAWAGIERLQLGLFDNAEGMDYVVPWPLGLTAEQAIAATTGVGNQQPPTYPPTSSLHQPTELLHAAQS